MIADSSPPDSGVEGAVDALYENARPFNAACVALPVTKERNEQLWLATRLRSIGSSSAAGALGMSRYETPYKAWLQATRQLERKDLSNVPAVKAGNRLEGVVRDWFADETSRRVEVVNAILVSKQFPFMHTCPDGRVVGEPSGLECKVAGHWAGISEEWGPSGSPESDAVPLNYLVQCVTSMIVTGYRTWYLAVLIGGNDFRWYTIRYDEELAGQITSQLEVFWRRVVAANRCIALKRDIPENVIPSSKTMEDVYARWPKSIPKEIEATPAILEAVDEFASLKRTSKDCSNRLDELKLTITSFMAENDTLVYRSSLGETMRLCTHKTGKPKATFDSKKHKDEVPACHAKYAVIGKETRTLLLKDDGGT